MNNRILQSLSYGLYAVGVKGEKYPTACIVNTVFQITSSPMMVAISINHANYTNECIKKQGEFTVSVLSENTSGAIIGALGFNSGRESYKMSAIRFCVRVLLQFRKIYAVGSYARFVILSKQQHILSSLANLPQAVKKSPEHL